MYLPVPKTGGLAASLYPETYGANSGSSTLLYYSSDSRDERVHLVGKILSRVRIVSFPLDSQNDFLPVRLMSAALRMSIFLQDGQIYLGIVDILSWWRCGEFNSGFLLARQMCSR